MATDQLLASALADREIHVRGDCIEAYQREFDYVCRTLRRLGIRRSDLEDVAHEVFLVVHRRWLDFDAERPLRPWLFGIAYRIAATHRKRARREALDPCLEIEDLAPRPDEALAVEQARGIVLAALARIPLPRRAVLVMHDLDGTEMREVAAALSIPLFTAYSRLRKARKELEASVASLTGRRKGELR